MRMAPDVASLLRDDAYAYKERTGGAAAPPAVPPACSELIPGDAPVSFGDQPGHRPAVAPDTGKRHKRGSDVTIVDNAHRVGIFHKKTGTAGKRDFTFRLIRECIVAEYDVPGGADGGDLHYP